MCLSAVGPNRVAYDLIKYQVVLLEVEVGFIPTVYHGIIHQLSRVGHKHLLRTKETIELNTK